MMNRVLSKKFIIFFLFVIFSLFYSSHLYCDNIETHTRMAAWHHTIVGTNQLYPNSVLLTYIVDDTKFLNQYVLTKIIPGIKSDGQYVWTSDAKNAVVEDFPGGVRSRFNLRDVEVKTEIIPLFFGRGKGEWAGAAIFKVSSNCSDKIKLLFGGNEEGFFHFPNAPCVMGDNINAVGCSVKINDNGTALLKSSGHPLTVLVKGPGLFESRGDECGQYLEITLESGNGRFLLAYGRNAKEAELLAGIDQDKAFREVKDYYHTLLSNNMIKTPVSSMNEAFEQALIVMEYNWLKPYGWNESIHHWLALWHMQHTPAAEWIGQADRSKQCILTHANNLFPDGSVPMFAAGGHKRKDWGGSNHIYLWQVRHYWRFTQDRDFLKQIEIPLDRIIKQTWQEYDRDGDGLLSWGWQIGNQEDFTSTPFNGTAPSIEGINMLRTRKEIAVALGDNHKAEQLDVKIQGILSQLHKQLWLPDLGRFAYYVDPYGYKRLDGPYQAYIYPAIWSILDDKDSWTSMRHLRDRMMGANGEIYCSNQFSTHARDVWATWGMQAGASQQPWGAWGLAEVGLNNEAYKPLKAVADWVMNDFHRGVWPEVALEKRLGYFSPPAAVYIQSVIEAIFGLELNKPLNTLYVKPCFPDKWPHAQLKLPGYTVHYEHQGNQYKYELTCEEPLELVLQWKLPPGEIKKFTVNGKIMPFQLQGSVGYQTLSFKTPSQKYAQFEFTLEPYDFALEHIASVAQGETFEVNVKNARIVGIDNRTRVLTKIEQPSCRRLILTTHKKLLNEYFNYGRLGEMNFARRSIFLDMESPNGIAFSLPIDITMLPKYQCQFLGLQKHQDNTLTLNFKIRNNTQSKLSGMCRLKIHKSGYHFEIDLNPRSEKITSVSLNQTDKLCSGDNEAHIFFPDGTSIPLFVNTSDLDISLKNFSHIELPRDELIPDNLWGKLRDYYSWPATASAGPNIMKAWKGRNLINIQEIPGLSFKLADSQFLPVAGKLKKPEVTVNVNAEKCRKLYILLLSFLDNHDMYSQVGRISIVSRVPGLVGNSLITKKLYYPGDVDSVYTNALAANFFSTANDSANRSRYALLPLMSSSDKDWSQGKPPEFPQSTYWCNSVVLPTDSCIANVIEFDLGQTIPVNSVIFSVSGMDPAFAIAAITIEH